MLAAVTLSGCSTKSAEPTSQPNSRSASTVTTKAQPRIGAGGARATLMVNGHTHTISGPVDCKTSPANPTATPTQAGTEKTEINADDDTASVFVSWSNATPTINGLSFTLKVDSGEYR
ncbi:MAG: hypothetical protein ACRDTN_02865, partial [Mycobacterium sp.]